jgi:prepilin-type N-terminal cleavage/methylation domain-containing protein/prepilin-type processing-associated H-X9-DG protein
VTASCRRRDRGFSLTELLIVIVIVGILAALLLPALSRGKESALSAACKNNARQQVFALSLYVADFTRFIPDMYLHKYNYLQRYIDQRQLGWNRGVFHCPAVQLKAMKMPGLAEIAYYGEITYAYNDVGTDVDSHKFGLAAEGQSWGPGLPESKIKAAQDMIALGDIGAWGTIWHHVRPLTPDESWFFSLPAHQRGANFAFCDGHIDFVKRASLEERSDRMKHRWNFDNQPHPETWK